MTPRKSLSFPFIRSESSQKDCAKSVSDLISNKKWNKLHKVFRRSNKKILDAIGSSGKFSKNNSLLHFGCKFSPPLLVIEKLVSAYPHSVYEVDHLNRFPLHVAVDYGASDKVIEFLLERNRDAAMALDAEGRSPLHLLFYNHHKDDESAYFQLSEVRKATHFVAWLLCVASPMSVTMKDVYGITVLDYAIDGYASDATVQMLKKASETVNNSDVIR